MDPSEHGPQLHTLNSLLTLATGTDPELARQIRAAIEFSMQDATPGGPDQNSLALAAETLLKLHMKDRPETAFELLDLRDDAYDPLFIRKRLILALRKLAGHPRAILLTTGLRRMVCPPGRRWTRRSRERYQSIKGYIEEVAAANSSPRTVLHLLFL